MSSRYNALETLFGEEGAKRVQNARILLVGAGGIGSEMLKELAVVGVGEIHVVDLDTIDLSNLNRQFLFSAKHIKQAKAKVAAEVAGEFNLNVRIVPHVANIMAAQFSPAWFRGFDLAFNALDNAEARRHVNKMCVGQGVPLIDAGTAGFEGQVQAILPRRTECYDCFSHPTPAAFPVCTIRSTPTLPIHSVVWAKSYLFNLLFGVDEDANPDADTAELDNTVTDDNKEEIERLKGEEAELAALRASSSDADFILKLVDKVFVTDIRRLLSMDTMWRGRRKPVPLELPAGFADSLDKLPAVSEGANAENGTAAEKADGEEASIKTTTDAVEAAARAEKAVVGEVTAISAPTEPTELGAQGAEKSTSRPEDDDQCVWTLVQDLNVLRASSKRLADRSKSGPISFDKDDEDALNFVAAASNLRSHIFGLQEKSKFSIKEIAGNIIPAIATTNAIVSGLGVLEAIKILAGREDLMRNVNIWRRSTSALRSDRPTSPNVNCPVCGSAYTTLKGQTADLTLENLIENHLKKELGYTDVSLVTDRLLYDPDYEDNADKTLSELGLADKMLTVIDEDDLRVNLEVYVAEPTEGEAVIEKVDIPLRPSRSKRSAQDLESGDEDADGLEVVGEAIPEEERTVKRPRPDDGIVELEPEDAPEPEDDDLDLRD